MLKPIVDSAVEKAPSRYSLVIGVAKRAREIVDNAIAKEEILVEKPVGIAVDQLIRHEYEIVELTEEEMAAYAAAKAEAEAKAKAEKEILARMMDALEEDEEDADDAFSEEE
jgi:DNA-directed RNA polymerase subunit omega